MRRALLLPVKPFRVWLFAGLVLLGSCSSTRNESVTVMCNGEVCDDHTTCMTGHCDPATGECIRTVDHTRCFAGEYCDEQLGCLPTGCTSDHFCSDGIDCTEDVCNQITGECWITPRDELCVGNDEHCDETDGCVVDNCSIASDCPGQSWCRTVECDNGVCRYDDVDCSLLEDQCNRGVCNPENGACDRIPVDEGTPCDDLDMCTHEDACAGGVCHGEEVDCSHLDEGCRQGRCKPADGTCGLMNRPDGTSCDDGDPCTLPDMCREGSCINDRNPCDDGYDCTEDICDPVDGSCDWIPHDSICPDSICFFGICLPAMVQAGTASGCVQIDYCQCLSHCVTDTDCALSDEECLPLMTGAQACLLPCNPEEPDDVACNDAYGNDSRTCARDPLAPGPLDGLCFCKPDCPQACRFDEECHPFGFVSCQSGKCMRYCDSDHDCPDPYHCGNDGTCRCGYSVQTGCLFCEDGEHCYDFWGTPAPCDNYRGVEYNECHYACHTNDDCPNGTGGSHSLYCRQNIPGSGEGVCSCEPQNGTQECLQCTANQTVCEPYNMVCLDSIDGANEIMNVCSAPCHVPEHCPEGWTCYRQSGWTHGWCLGTACVPCTQVSCNGPGDPACNMIDDTFDCVDTNSDPYTSEFQCTKPCVIQSDCPPDYQCLTGADGTSWCRCE